MQLVAADITVALLTCAAAVLIWGILSAFSRPASLLTRLGLTAVVGLIASAAQQAFNEPLHVPLQVGWGLIRAGCCGCLHAAH
jgi:hypothetical protein